MPQTKIGSGFVSSGAISVSNLSATGTPSSSTFLRGDGAWASPGLVWQAVQTTNFTAVSGRGYPVNTTSGAITVTFPSSPSIGDSIVIIDYASTFATNNCTINPSGANLQGATTNAILNTLGLAINFVYVDSTRGWLPYASTSGRLARPYSISWLLAAGGGGGGGANSQPGGSGGGAGGLGLASSVTFVPGTVITVTVGAGGSAVNANNATSGSNSVISFGAVTETAYGGGYGCVDASTASTGGSSGGGTPRTAPSASATRGAGTYSTFYGNVGGSAAAPNNNGAGGGGGAGGAGVATTTVNGANGGVGLQSSITGSAVYYSGGGGGGGGYNGGSGSTGGLGGGGNGASQTGVGGAATANTGGGGGGAGGSAQGGWQQIGGNGGSGVVILSLPTVSYSGVTTGSPTVTTSGSNTILRFTASGTYTA